jgi:hypothetical protein
MGSSRLRAKATSRGSSVSGDRKLKEGAPRLASGRPKPPTMGFDNRAADREAHAHSVGLRRVEGFEETRQSFGAQPRAGVSHPEAHLVRFRLSCGDEHLSGAVCNPTHCLDGVENEIEDDLL